MVPMQRVLKYHLLLQVFYFFKFKGAGSKTVIVYHQWIVRMRGKGLYQREVVDISIDLRLICYEIKSSQVQVFLQRSFLRPEAYQGKNNKIQLFPQYLNLSFLVCLKWLVVPNYNHGTLKCEPLPPKEEAGPYLQHAFKMLLCCHKLQ